MFVTFDHNHILKIPELISRLPVSRLFDAGAKALNIARYWPAGLASLVVGAAPTTGAVVGVVAIAIFIIVIWLVIYSNYPYYPFVYHVRTILRRCY